MRTYQKDGEAVSLYPIKALAKPRMTARDKWKGRPVVLRYHAFKDEVRIRKVQLDLNHFYHVIFVVPMPKSWTVQKKSRHDFMPMQQVPDKDNLEKALLDALYQQDREAWDGRVTKVWGREPWILISERNMDVRPHSIARMIAESQE